MAKPYRLVAKAIIFDEQNRVLIMRRSEAERKGKTGHGFDFPGGSVEMGELMLQGLAREVFEETGLSIDVFAPAYVYDEIQADKQLVIIKYACGNPKGTVLLSEEHEAYEWLPSEQLEASEYPQWMKQEIQQALQIYRSFHV